MTWLASHPQILALIAAVLMYRSGLAAVLAMHEPESRLKDLPDLRTVYYDRGY